MNPEAPLTLQLLDAGRPDLPVLGRVVCPGQLRVGRAALNDVRLGADDREASNYHFTIDLGPAHCRLLNLSQNGTFINGILTHGESDLRYGDLLRAGQTVLRVDLRRGDEPAMLPSSLTVAYSPPLDPTVPVEPVPAVQAVEQVTVAQVPGYRLIRILGSGGMGTVWLAEDRSGRQVALKLIRPDLALDRATCARFRRETDHLRDLAHPHIVGFCGAGDAGGLLYLAMEYVPGSSLAALLELEGPFAVGRAVRLIRQVLLALACSHGAGVVHRDVKPSNILVTPGPGGEEARLADFGLAKAYRSADVGSHITLPGTLGGTLAFVAPDQILDFRGAGPLADQYGAAATLYNLLTQRHPHEAASHVELLDRIRHSDPVPLSWRRPGLPAGLEEVLHRALAREPGRRFPTVTAFDQALEPYAPA